MYHSVEEGTVDENMDISNLPIDFSRDRFPCCIVWTPIPLLTWLFPPIGHMGITYSNGVIRDFAGPYYVSEDNMGFGRPTRYVRLNPKKVSGGLSNWDRGVYEASEIYKTRMHNLCCDNCHSHVSTALDLMEYDGKSSWNMFKVAILMFFCGRYVGFFGFFKTWAPFVCLAIFLLGSLFIVTCIDGPQNILKYPIVVELKNKTCNYVQSLYHKYIG